MSGCWKDLLPLLLLLLQVLVPCATSTTVGDTTSSATGLLLADLFPGEGHSFPSRFQWIRDKLYFRMDFGSDSSHRLCVVLSYGEPEDEVEDPADDLIHHPVSTGALADSASSELRLHRILLEDPSPSSDLVQFPQPVHFEAWGDDGVLICSHAGLYLYNETDRSVLQLTNTRNLSCSVDFDLVHFQGRVYFAADHAPQNLGTELWATNGTPEGTVLVQDIKQGPTDSNPEGPVVTRDYLFFFANHWLSYTNGTTVERVSTEGIEGGLRLTPNIHTNAQAVANGTILVLPAMTISPQWSTDLWAIDTTTSNPFEITRLTPADPDVSVQSASPLDEDRVLFWTQHKSSYKYTLWVSDGTVNGTNPILGELENQLDTPITNRFTPLGDNNKGMAVFAVQRGNTNSQLYRTDGTSKGTYPIYETNAGNLKVRSNWATFQDKLYFVVADEDQDCTSLYHCSELYVTDGETVQRQLIDWIQGGSSILDSLSYSITDKTPTMHPMGDDMLVFGAKDPNLNYGVELWAIELPEEEAQVVDPDTADLTEGSQSTLLQEGESFLEETAAPTPTPGDDSTAEESPTEPTTIDANTEVVVSKVEKSGENVSPSKVNNVSSSATPRLTWCGLWIMTLFLQTVGL